MGLFTTSSKTGGTLRSKAAAKLANGKTCIVCGEALVSFAPNLVTSWASRANVHPACTRKV
ncbi:hypothetical protein [Crossiella sp. CA198]|uniref:hypothetical protein n=1 Tax=Crossiella sp. CA198 TaxID=3455607 RepID=UPI003F8D4738